MVQVIKPKRGTSTPTTAILQDGEMGVDLSLKKLYVRDGATIKEIGGYYLTVQVITASTTAVAGRHYHIESNNVVLTLPASPVGGDVVFVSKNTSLFGSVARNGKNIEGAAVDFSLTAEKVVGFRYINAAWGWAVITESFPETQMVSGGDLLRYDDNGNLEAVNGNVRITAAGYLNCGTNVSNAESSAGDLVLLGGSGVYFYLQSFLTGYTATDGLVMQLQGTNATILNYENGTFALGTNSQDVMSMDVSGNVSVRQALSLGNLSPLNKSTADLLYLEGVDSGTAEPARITFTDNGSPNLSASINFTGTSNTHTQTFNASAAGQLQIGAESLLLYDGSTVASGNATCHMLVDDKFEFAFDGVVAARLDNNSTSTFFGDVVLDDVSPTISFLDSTVGANPGFIHVNSNTMYFLRGAPDATTWTQFDGEYPLQISLADNDAIFGGDVYVRGTLPLVRIGDPGAVSATRGGRLELVNQNGATGSGYVDISSNGSFRVFSVDGAAVEIGGRTSTAGTSDLRMYANNDEFMRCDAGTTEVISYKKHFWADDDLTTKTAFGASTLNTTTPIVQFDATDYIEYDRTNNQFSMCVGSTTYLDVDASNISSTHVYNNSVTGRDVYVNSSFNIGYLSSTIRHKENVDNMPYGLTEVMQLRPVLFNWKKEIDKDGFRDAGFIAEEVDELGLTEFVDYEEDGVTPISLRYKQMVALLTSAVQELTQRVEALEHGRCKKCGEGE